MRRIALAAFLLASPALGAASFDHFTGTSAPAGWTLVTSGNGVMCMNGTLVAGSGGSCPGSVSGETFFNSVTPANADAAFAYSGTISKTVSAIYWLTVRSDSTLHVALMDASTPTAGTNTNVYGNSGYALSRASIGTSTFGVGRYANDATRTRTEWTGSAWAAPTQNSSTNVADNFQTIGLEVDGANQRYRWHGIGNSGTGSTTPSYALYHHTTTDWIDFSFHEGTAASYCNPTCTSLRLTVGDLLTDALAETNYVEWYAVDEGAQQLAWVNQRNNGGTWTIRRFWGYPAASGFVERMVPEDRSTNALNVGGSGAWDEQHVKDPVVTLGSNGTYYMTYSAARVSDGKFQIGCATASSPAGPWTKCPNNPLVALSAGTTEDQISNPVLAEDLAEPDASKRWKLFYMGVDTSSPTKRYTYVRTCSAPPSDAACDTAGEWSAKVELLAPGSGGAIDDRGWGRILPYRFFGRPFLDGAVIQNGGPTQASYAEGAYSGTMTKSGVVTVAAGGSNCDTTLTAGATTTRTITVASTTGCSPDQFIVLDDDSGTANYHRNRILRVASSTSLVLYHREDGLASGANVRGAEAFGQVDAGVIREYAPGQWVRYATCFDPLLNAPSGNDAYSENVCAWTGSGPLGPWTITQLAPPLMVGNAFGAQHSLENPSLVNGPLRAPPVFVGPR
jgi:hypothetical protein